MSQATTATTVDTERAELVKQLATVRSALVRTTRGLTDEQAAARTAQVIAGADLSVTHALPEAPWYPVGENRSVRQVLLHVIAETAQHAGHADILRESIDGQTSG